MKKILFFIFAMVVLASCKTNVPKSTKGTRQANRVIKGEWVLSSVTHNGKGKYDVTLFKDTSKECFEGSYWKFVPNNYRGTYSISKQGCASGDRNFVFVVEEVDKNGYYDFLLKPTNEKYQSSTNTGIRLHLAYLSDTEMRWEQTISVEGKPFVISMNFTK